MLPILAEQVVFLATVVYTEYLYMYVIILNVIHERVTRIEEDEGEWHKQNERKRERKRNSKLRIIVTCAVINEIEVREFSKGLTKQVEI